MTAQPVLAKRPTKVLIPFNTVSLYGMERGVIETFDLLRPEVEAHFLMSHASLRRGLPVLSEIRKRGLAHTFFSDTVDWPRVGKPKSAASAFKITFAMLKGNRDVWRAAASAEVIYVSSLNYFYFALLEGLVGSLKSKKIIFHFHDLLTNYSRQLGTLNRFVTDYVHNTELSRAETVKSNPFVATRKNWVVPYPVLRSHTPAAKDEKRVNPNLLFVGQVAKHKGIDLLLDAYERLKLRHPQLMLDVVGGCDDAELIRRMDSLSANGQAGVRRWGYRDDVLAMMKEADIYVQPSRPSLFHESFGRGVVEAMSVGTPSVCFESGALKEIVRDGRTGLICPQETAECLAEKIDQFLTDADFKKRCGQESSAVYEQEYSNTLVKSKWLDLLTSA